MRTIRRVALVGAVAAVALAGAFVPATASGTRNDALRSARTVTTLPFTASQSTSDATVEPGEEDLRSCARAGNTVWFRVRTDRDQLVRAHTIGSDFDTVLTVYRGNDMSSLERVTCNDQLSAESDQSDVVFRARRKTWYLIQVGGFRWGYEPWYPPAHGNLVLTVEDGPSTPPANDRFADAAPVTLEAAETFFDERNTLNATVEPNEPQCPSVPDGAQPTHSVWYRHVETTASAGLSIRADGDYGVVLSVYEDTDGTIGGLKLVGCAAEPDTGLTSERRVLTWWTAPGMTHYVQVSRLIAEPDGGNAWVKVYKHPLI